MDIRIGSGWTPKKIGTSSKKRFVTLELCSECTPQTMADYCQNDGNGCPLGNGGELVCPFDESKRCKGVKAKDWEGIIECQSMLGKGFVEMVRKWVGEAF